MLMPSLSTSMDVQSAEASRPSSAVETRTADGPTLLPADLDARTHAVAGAGRVAVDVLVDVAKGGTVRRAVTHRFVANGVLLHCRAVIAIERQAGTGPRWSIRNWCIPCDSSAQASEEEWRDADEVSGVLNGRLGCGFRTRE